MNNQQNRQSGERKTHSTTPKRTNAGNAPQKAPAARKLPKKTVIGAVPPKKKVQSKVETPNSGTNEHTTDTRQTNKMPENKIPTIQEAPVVSGKKYFLGFEIGFNKKTVVLAVILSLVIANIIAIASITQRKIPERFTPEQVENASRVDLEKMFESPFNDVRIHTSDYKKGILVLINDTYAFDNTASGKDIPDSALVQVNRQIKDRSFKARDNTTKLSEDTVNALNLMFADFVAGGGRRDVMINEAYRSYEDQKSIFDSKVKQLGGNQTIAQRPGYSEHHTGYAVDFSIYPDGGKGARTFTREEHYAWIYENCHKYGFVLRYPENKTHITGISPESWHFRYVGVPHASYMYERGITLEEYLSEIKVYTENIPLTFKADGVEYGVYYVERGMGEYTDFKVPKQTEYCISGDNVGGFIVWYKISEPYAE